MEVGFKNEALAEELRAGFHIVGELSDCLEFPQDRVEARMGVEGLRTVSKWSQYAVIGQLRKTKQATFGAYLGQVYE